MLMNTILVINLGNKDNVCPIEFFEHMNISKNDLTSLHTDSPTIGQLL